MKIFESEYGGGPNNFHITKDGEQLNVELTYPPKVDGSNPHNQVRYVFIDQESARASDGIRVYYDYERDGFVIQQASTFEWDADDEVQDEDWQEVAFVESWARKKDGEE